MTGVPAGLASALQDRYRLDRELGQGGMATVFLAQDLRNNRKVAIKVLRPELAAILGAERFLKEIETTANLQHPNILSLFDSGEAGGGPGMPGPFLYYVMPYIAGENLRDRLKREKQLPIADIVRIATEVAGALDYAHRSGILHRDIKPENILLHDGRAIVADFGIALAMRNAGGARLTETGLSIGTPQYMSPEQATAERGLDARTDIYALGAVTYEMLTGEPPFMGNTTQAVIAKLMTEVPRPPSVLRKSVPPAVERAVLTALEKLPADRWASAAEFATALSGTGRLVDTNDATQLYRHPRRPALGSQVNIALAAVAILASALALWGYFSGRFAGAAGAIPTRATIPLGQGLLLAQDGLPFDISADGSEIVYSGDSGATSQLYLRPLGGFEGRAIPGTEGGIQPFLSPDGKWIGFFADGKLKKVARDGGAPISLADAPSRWEGASWGSDGNILFALRGSTLYRVSADGGPTKTILVIRDSTAAGDSALVSRPITTASWPSLLPDGEHALITTNGEIGVVTLATGVARRLLVGNRARYLPTGHLIYDEGEGRIRVVPFDLRRMQVTGGPLPAFEAFRGPGSGAAQFAVSQNGTLVYVAGGFNRSLVLVDRDGHEATVPVPLRGYRFPAFSPDGQRVGVTIDPRPSSLWVVDLRQGQMLRLTREAHSLQTVWAPDGERIALSCCGGVQWMRWRDGNPPQPVLTAEPRSQGEVYPTSWAPDGRIVSQRMDSSYRDLVTLTIGDSVIRPLLATPAAEWQGDVSRDGRWLAYRSNLSGVDEIYARQYPGGGTSTLVSRGGGVEPRWSADGRELYFRQGSRIMAVPIRTSPSFAVLGPPRLLFVGAYDFSQTSNWDVGPDGRFIMVRADPASRGQLLVVLNWFTELAQAERKP